MVGSRHLGVTTGMSALVRVTTRVAGPEDEVLVAVRAVRALVVVASADGRRGGRCHVDHIQTFCRTFTPVGMNGKTNTAWDGTPLRTSSCRSRSDRRDNAVVAKLS